MEFHRIEPAPELKQLVEYYWLAQSDDQNREKKKIIPDGFTEIIFHYRDPYRINISGHWEQQERSLLAGQIGKHFYLENTGASGMLGIKFKPAAITQMFGLKMIDFTDRVVPVDSVLPGKFQNITSALQHEFSMDELHSVLDESLILLSKNLKLNPEIELIVDLIIKHHGNVSVGELAERANLTERKLQRLFNYYIGVAPKFYCRIIRFSSIFQMLEKNDAAWVEVALESGYYDQPHFIRNFKTFTGEDPSRYGFEAQTLANFFMLGKLSGLYNRK